MTQFLLQVPADRQQAWMEALANQMPDLEVSVWPDVSPGTEFDYALVWNPPPELFDRTESIKAFFSLGAGIDHLLPHLERVAERPIVRMVDPVLVEGMSEYVIYFAMMFHRGMHRYAEQQSQREWVVLPQAGAAERHIGVLGMGAIGAGIASKLVALGFTVHGYSRSGKDIEGVISYSGEQGLHALAANVDILVNVLPLTVDTRSILSADLFMRMRSGGFVINIGRGPHLVEQDLIAAVHSGQLGGAALDVFETEPLPANSELWNVPGVFVTPHMASLTQPKTAAQHVIQNVRRHINGEPLWPVFEKERGY